MKLRAICKSKIHHAVVTGADLNYEGSIGIDAALMRLTDIVPGEQVSVWNLNNGQRIETYAISLPEGSGRLVVNGAAARLFQPGDYVIIVAFCLTDEAVESKMIAVDEHNAFVKHLHSTLSLCERRHAHRSYTRPVRDGEGVDVTFVCECPQSHVEAVVQEPAGRSEVGRLLFEQSGRRRLRLAAGVYDIAYRAQGTAETPFLLKVVGGGSMRPVDRRLPPDGQAAGARLLFVVARSLLMLLAVHLLYPARAAAQAPDGSSDKRRQAERSLTTLPNVSDVLQSGYYMTLQAASDSRTGTATVAIENAVGSLTTSLSLTAPLDKSTKEARPLTIDGLPNDGTATIGLHWFRWPNHPDAAAMRQLCRQALHRDECDDNELTDPKDRRAFTRLAHSGDAPIIINIRGSAGRDGFKFVDRETLENESQTRTSWSLALGIGRYAPGIGYVAVELGRQRQFLAEPAAELCRTTPTGALICRSAVVGPPVARTLDVGRLEWRLFFAGGRVATNPSVSHDFRSGVSSIDLPLYCLALPSGQPRGRRPRQLAERYASNQRGPVCRLGAAADVTLVALGPHPRRELTPMLALGSARPRGSHATPARLPRRRPRHGRRRYLARTMPSTPTSVRSTKPQKAKRSHRWNETPAASRIAIRAPLVGVAISIRPAPVW